MNLYLYFYLLSLCISFFQFKDIIIPLSEFIPYFLAYLHDKLNISTNNASAYFSPRQLEKRKKERNELKKDEGDRNKDVPKKSARLSLQYASSSPMKKIQGGKHATSIKGISPIKNTLKSPSPKSEKNHLVKSPLQGSSGSKSNFELNSLEDFPSISYISSVKK